MKLFILAGPNGSGKSTLYRKLIGKYKALSKLPFIILMILLKRSLEIFYPMAQKRAIKKCQMTK
jgi:ABC-type hemin transport system ATPase subunit